MDLFVLTSSRGGLKARSYECALHLLPLFGSVRFFQNVADIPALNPMDCILCSQQEMPFLGIDIFSRKNSIKNLILVADSVRKFKQPPFKRVLRDLGKDPIVLLINPVSKKEQIDLEESFGVKSILWDNEPFPHKAFETYFTSSRLRFK